MHFYAFFSFEDIKVCILLWNFLSGSKVQLIHYYIQDLLSCYYIYFYLVCCISSLVGAADHPKSDEYLSDPRLAAYAVPYSPVDSWYIFTCSMAKYIMFFCYLI